MRFLKSLLLFVFFLLASVTVHASSRETLLYQGLLFDTAGDPITGSILVTFRFYESDAGGAAVWEEVQSLPVEDGVYTAELGSQVSFPSDLFDNDALFLGIQIEGDSEMTPRLGLFSVPWAQQAEVAITALSLANDVVTGVNIAPSSIESSDIAPGAIGATEIASSGVTAGTYTVATITVDQDGRITSASSGSEVSLLGSAIESSEITNATITDVDISGSAAITWTKVSKTGALPGDVGAATAAHTHAAGDIVSGEISDARVSDTLTASNLVASSSVVSDAEVDDNLTISATGSVADGALSTNVSLLGSSIESGEITDLTIVNTDISGSAAIAGTKVSPDFGSQAVTTSGSISTTGSGNITAGGDLAAAGGFKTMIGPFEENNVAAGVTRQWALGTEDNSVEDVAVPWAGSVMGVSVTCAPALGAGAGSSALTVEPLIDGAATGLTAAVSASGSSATATQAKDTDTFAAGATIGCRAVTTASYTPTSLECVCMVFIEM